MDSNEILLTISVPGKTFLLGEYLVLKKGPALLISTSPRFLLKVASGSHEQGNFVSGISMQSPAGRLITANQEIYQNYTLYFVDPYNQLGGFGASTAQFLAAISFKNYLQKVEMSDLALLQTYIRFAWNGKKFPPSGVDLLAQKKG